MIDDADEGTLVEDIITLDAVGDAEKITDLTGELNESAKVLKLTANEGEIFEGRYSLTVIEVEDIDGNELVPYAGFFTANDITRPTVTGVTYTSVDEAKILFSEPIEDYGRITLNGEDVDTEEKFDFVFVNITDLDYEEKGTITIVGARDYAGNLITPNPTNVNIVRPEEDKTDPEVESISIVSDTRVKVVFSEELKAVEFFVNSDTALSENNVTIDDDKVTYYLNVNLLDGVNKVVVKNYVDLADNTGKDVTRQFIVETDKKAPELSNSSVHVNDDGEEYLQLTFSESIKLGSGDETTFTGTRVLDYVTYEDEFNAVPVLDEDDDTKVNIPLHDAEEGNWTIKLEEGFVTDLAKAENELEAVEVSFARGEDKEEDEPSELTVDANVQNNKVTLTFNGSKLSGATAINKSNYAVEGAAIKSAVLTQNSENQAKVELTFESGSIKVTGNYELVITGVKAADGTLVDVDPVELDLTENIAPKLISATLVSGTQIEITFSEAVVSVDKEDFVVLVGDDEVEISEITEDSTREHVIVLSEGLNSEQLAETITLELAEGFDIKDTVGNKLVDFDALTVTIDIK